MSAKVPASTVGKPSGTPASMRVRNRGYLRGPAHVPLLPCPAAQAQKNAETSDRKRQEADVLTWHVNVACDLAGEAVRRLQCGSATCRCAAGAEVGPGVRSDHLGCCRSNWRARRNCVQAEAAPRTLVRRNAPDWILGYAAGPVFRPAVLVRKPRSLCAIRRSPSALHDVRDRLGPER